MKQLLRFLNPFAFIRNAIAWQIGEDNYRYSSPMHYHRMKTRKSIFDEIEHSPTGSGLTSEQAQSIADMYLPVELRRKR